MSKQGSKPRPTLAGSKGKGIDVVRRDGRPGGSVGWVWGLPRLAGIIRGPSLEGRNELCFAYGFAF